MKGKIRILIAIIIYIGIGALGIQFYLPSKEFIVEDITRDSEGNIYAAGETRTGVYVYRLDSDGIPQQMFRCKSEAEEMQLFCQYEAGNLYLAQMWYQDGIQWFSVWEKAERKNDFQRIWRKSIVEDVTLTDFQVRDGILYVTGVDQQTENILLYIGEGGTERRVRLEADFIPTTVCWGKNGMYTLSQDNHIYFIAENGIMQRRELEDVVFFLADKNGLYYQRKGSEDIIYLFENGLGSYTFEKIGAAWNIQYSERAQNSAVLKMSQDNKDEFLLVGLGEETVHVIDCTAVDLREKAKNLCFPLLLYTLMYLLVWIVLELFWRLVWRRRRLLYQTMAALAGFTGIWLAVTIAGIWFHEIEEQQEQQKFLADTCMNIQKEKLIAAIKSARGILQYEDYEASEQQKSVEEIFSGNVMGNESQPFYMREELVCMNQDHLVFLYAEEAPYGRQADTFYDALTLQKIQDCITMETLPKGAHKFIDKVNGISYAMAVSKVGDDKQQVCLLSRVPLYGMSTHQEVTHIFYIVTVIGWLLVMAALAFFLRWKWKNIGMLCTAMERVSRGEYVVDSRKAPDNEFGLMWLGLERMCKTLQRQKYKTDATIEYLDQYAPQNFERLFAKEKLQDIQIGETMQMAATLGMISVIDKETLLTGKLQRQYVQYVNQLMELLFSQNESSQAVFLQDGSNLENVKVIFQGEEQSALTAVRYSIDCMEELLEQIEDTYDTNPFILLHTDQFRCGLAGGSKQVYPYVTSMEMDTLSRYIDALKHSGARVVVTEQTWQQVLTQVQGRRIGYVTSADEKSRFWLYEILDACPQMQKLGKLKNRECFEQALEMYYNDDLYSARSAFTEIVRECPEDGIAKWYVFACDERLNKGADKDSHYELFWGSFACGGGKRT